MTITDVEATNFGFLVLYAEDMYVAGQTQPHEEPRIGLAGWDLVGYLIAQDAILPDRSTLPPGALKCISLDTTVFYGYLARSKADPNSYLVAVRGTSSFAEWVIDADFVPIPHPGLPGATVERGFWSVYDSMQLIGLDGKILDAKAAAGIAAIVGAGTATIAGHSLGAAVATYLSFDVAKLLGDRASACLFCSPRSGGRVWTTAYDAAVANYRLITYALDVVPYVPFDAPLFQYSTLSQNTVLQPSSAQAEVRFDVTCNHHVLSSCAMLDYVDTKKRVDPEDQGSWSCVIGPPGFSLNFALIDALATAVNALGAAGRDIVKLLSASARAKGGHV